MNDKEFEDWLHSAEFKELMAPWDELTKKYNNTTMGIYDKDQHCIGQFEEGDDGFIELLLDSNMAYHKVWHYPSRLPDNKSVSSYFKSGRRGNFPIYKGKKHKGDGEWVNFPDEIVRAELSGIVLNSVQPSVRDELLKSYDELKRPAEPEKMPQTAGKDVVGTKLYDKKGGEIGQLFENDSMYLKVQLKGIKGEYTIEDFE